MARRKRRPSQIVVQKRKTAVKLIQEGKSNLDIKLALTSKFGSSIGSSGLANLRKYIARPTASESDILAPSKEIDQVIKELIILMRANDYFAAIIKVGEDKSVSVRLLKQEWVETTIKL